MLPSLKKISFTLLLISFYCFSQNESAIYWSLKYKQHHKEDTIRVTILNSYANEIYLNSPEKALSILKESEVLSKKINYPKGSMMSNFHLSQIYGNQKKYDLAQHYASEGLAIANKYHFNSFRKKFFLLITEWHYDKNEKKKDTTLTEEVRDIKAAIKYKYFLKDSLNKSEKNVMHLKKEIDNKNSELTLIRLEKYLWTIGFLAIVILFGFVYTLQSNRKIKLENKQLLTEQKLLRSQMNPHFIFNSIQNIRSLIQNQHLEEAIHYLNQFARLTRQVLESSNENYIALAEELELIEHYISLQQMLYQQTFRYSISIDDALDQNAIFIPPMLLQPFIENAIKHGITHIAIPGELTLRFYFEGTHLFFEIQDNGIGFIEQNKNSTHQSLALTITKERLLRYNKCKAIYFKTENILDKDKKVVGAKVLFEIPYIYEN